MMRETGSAVAVHSETDGVEAVLLPYYSQNGEGWLLTYPSFQIALNKDLAVNGRRDDAMRVLEVMLSEDGQNVLAGKKDVISYKKDVKLELREELNNLQPFVEKNRLYIRLASNEFFSISRDVVQKMILGEYDAKEAYNAFDEMLKATETDESETAVVFDAEYSSRFDKNGGNRAASAMANTLRTMYGADILISPSYNFTGSALKTGYTAKMLGYMIMPNACQAYVCESLTGADVKKLVCVSVEGAEETRDDEGVFVPFNCSVLPVVSGIEIKVEEEADDFTLLSVSRDGKELDDSEVFKVVYLNPPSYYGEIVPNIFPEETEKLFVPQSTRVRMAWTEYIKAGNPLDKPKDYITVIDSKAGRQRT